MVLDIGGEARECTVARDGDTITGTRSLAGMQPAVSMDEYFEAGAACRRDAGFREALARRGIEGDQVELVHIEPWTVGGFEQAAAAGGALPGVAALSTRRRQPLRPADRAGWWRWST